MVLKIGLKLLNLFQVEWENNVEKGLYFYILDGLII